MKNCLILGGTGTIGTAVTQALQAQDSKVALSYHQNKTAAENSAAVAFAQCEFTDPKSIIQTVNDLCTQLGTVDVLICAVGNSRTPFDLTLENISAENFDACTDINTRGVLLACQAALPFLKKSAGSIVVLGTLDGIKSVPSPVHFASSKSALKGMIQAMSKELGKFQIKVNLVVPGIVDSGASKYLTEKLKKEYLKHCSMKRFAKPSEIAEMVSWLALENTYVTGQAILLDGGL